MRRMILPIGLGLRLEPNEYKVVAGFGHIWQDCVPILPKTQYPHSPQPPCSDLQAWGRCCHMPPPGNVVVKLCIHAHLIISFCMEKDIAILSSAYHWVAQRQASCSERHHYCMHHLSALQPWVSHVTRLVLAALPAKTCKLHANGPKYQELGWSCI